MLNRVRLHFKVLKKRPSEKKILRGQDTRIKSNNTLTPTIPALGLNDFRWCQARGHFE